MLHFTVIQHMSSGNRQESCQTHTATYRPWKHKQDIKDMRYGGQIAGEKAELHAFNFHEC